MFYVCGDTHGDLDWEKLNSENFPEGKWLTKDDYVLICGDFGGVWDGSKYDKYVQDWYNKKPWTTLVVPGNHENWDLIDKLPTEKWHDGLVKKISDSIIVLMRGEVYEIDGRTIFTFGGAQSTDKKWRKEGVSWWAREMPSEEEYENGFKNLERYGYNVDYVFTHCAPNQVFNYLRARGYLSMGSTHDRLTGYLDLVRAEVEQKEKFKGWYLGHYHTDLDIAKYHIMYDWVERLW